MKHDQVNVLIDFIFKAHAKFKTCLLCIYKPSLIVLLINDINSSSRSFSLMQININSIEKITHK